MSTVIPVTLSDGGDASILPPIINGKILSQKDTKDLKNTKE